MPDQGHAFEPESVETQTGEKIIRSVKNNILDLKIKETLFNHKNWNFHFKY